MRYLQDKELYQYVERELLPGLADDCALEFSERFGLLLDRSPASLTRIDQLIAASETFPDREALARALGAYLGAVLCSSDGAKWSAGFDRENGVDGYTASRLRVYEHEVDVFNLATLALSRSQPLAESFQILHRPAPRGSAVR